MSDMSEMEDCVTLINNLNNVEVFKQVGIENVILLINELDEFVVAASSLLVNLKAYLINNNPDQTQLPLGDTNAS